MTLLSALLEKRDPIQTRAIGPSNLAWDRGEEYGTYDESLGVRVDRDTMLGVSAVWACVSLIADSVATMPLGVYRNVKGAAALATSPDWLAEPNPEQTITDFKFGTVASLLMDGNAYIYLVRNAKQDIIEAWLLDPRWVYVRREYQKDGTLALNYYVMVGKGMQSPVGPFMVPAGPDMFHIMAFQPSSSWPMGIGPLEVARTMFGAAIAGQQMAGNFFGRGFNASGVIEVEDDMTADQAKQIKQDFKDANGGIRKMHLPPVLTGGATYKTIQINPEQAQFLQQRQFGVDEIARWFRVPPHMIGNLEKTSSWGAGIEQQSIGFVQYTLRPWLERIEQSWTRNMLTFQPGTFFRFDVSSLLQGDMSTLAEFALRMHAVGGLSANELRTKYLNLPPFDGGDTHYFMVNTAPVGTEPITLQKIPTDVSDEDAPVLDGEKAQPAEQNSVTLDAIDRALDQMSRIHKENGNGHRSGDMRIDVTAPPAVNVRVEQPDVAAPDVHVHVPEQRRIRRTITFTDGREPVVVTEEPDDE